MKKEYETRWPVPENLDFFKVLQSRWVFAPYPVPDWEVLKTAGQQSLPHQFGKCTYRLHHSKNLTVDPYVRNASEHVELILIVYEPNKVLKLSWLYEDLPDAGPFCRLWLWQAEALFDWTEISAATQAMTVDR